MATNPLAAEFEYYQAHQNELVKRFNGKFVVIKKGTVLGSYPDELTAINETQKSHALGTFLVQKCEPGTESTTQVFHSRVAFC